MDYASRRVNAARAYGNQFTGRYRVVINGTTFGFIKAKTAMRFLRRRVRDGESKGSLFVLDKEGKELEIKALAELFLLGKQSTLAASLIAEYLIPTR